MEKRLEIRNLSKSFGRKGYETQVLRNIQAPKRLLIP